MSPNLERLALRVPSPAREWMTKPEARWSDEYNGILYKWRTQEYNKSIVVVPDPLFNQKSTLKLFQKMRARKMGRELREMEFYVDDWEGRYYRGMIGNLIMRVAHWRCFIDGNGSDKEKCEGGQARFLD
ncbi:hypothetical protein G7Y89_g10413 [Cudoniella acicularis]|uniref:Uncharacterized protein n=1 Tax=Cudoniella acicularis TaxID=354080 RepID=A0A8H4RCV0_9HELO|nr:hypothetical protein G7Y89_g10413 [Cudoniella acicularis]